MKGRGQVPLEARVQADQSPVRPVYGSGPQACTVEKPWCVVVFGWSIRSAVAAVGGVTVRIRRRADGQVRWICVEHGQGSDAGLCAHTLALSRTPAPLDKLNGPRPAESWWDQ